MLPDRRAYGLVEGRVKLLGGWVVREKVTRGGGEPFQRRWRGRHKRGEYAQARKEVRKGWQGSDVIGEVDTRGQAVLGKGAEGKKLT